MSIKIPVPIQKTFWVVGQGNARNYQNNIGYTLNFGCQSKFDGKPQFLKLPHTPTRGIGGILLEQPSPPPPWGLVYLITEGAVQSANGEEQSVLLFSFITYEPNKDQDGKLF